MATKRTRSEDTCDDVMICPVCTNEFNDPRLLDCGHHFCLGCLEKISKGKVRVSIQCPTCRHITREKVNDLKKYKCNEFTAKVSMFMSQKRARIGKVCGLCAKSTPATFTCRECQANLCDDCKETHDKLEQISGHKATPISEFIFCEEHHEKFVHCICETCDRFLCLPCFVQHDKTHSFADIREAASKAKEQLKAVVSTVETLPKDKTLSQFVKEAMNKLKKENNCTDRSISEIENKIAVLQEKVKHFKKRKEEIFQKELKELEMLENETTEFIQTKEDLMQHVSELLDSASDCEIIRREKDFPKYASDSVGSVFTKFCVEIPQIKEIQSVADLLTSMENRLDFNSHLEPIIPKEKALKPMEVHTQFNICSNSVYGLAYDPNNDTYVVRTGDAEKLIQVFDTSGKNIKTIGCKREGIDRESRVAIDTKRKLYLIPTADGKIVTIDYEGQEEKVIDVANFRLIGISYCTIPVTGTDRYIVSSAKFTEDTEEVSHSVYIIDPEEGTVLKEIKNEANTFHPYSVSSFSTLISGARIVAGYYNGGPRVFDLQGKLIKVFKRPQEEMPKVLSVCCDYQPAILVCGEKRDDFLYYRYEEDKGSFHDPNILLSLEDIKKHEPKVTVLDKLAFDLKRRRILLMCRGATDKVFVLKEK